MATILFVRHGDHKQNVLTPEARADAIQLGEDLKKDGHVIKYCSSSPLGRCLQTALCILQGYGKILPIDTIRELGDISTDEKLPQGFMDDWKQMAMDKFGGTSDVDLARAMLLDDGMMMHMLRRAHEGAKVLSYISTWHPHDTTLVVSHAVARMEPTLRQLLGKKDVLAIPDDELIARGECMEVEMVGSKVISLRKFKLT
ncbi:MAG TPA: hypothetical protein DEP63_02950 [Candidatus Magasanikbacteria bacterium]|nr:hypothetical protein [Candidatus Magasanikbacteria bacterium]HCC13680.1 hypothetical protein [Candidatus Magasanikbacteria bacterium]HCM53630.1 hypothetical protein [Candidatus Magasanikbacteria bacterium]